MKKRNYKYINTLKFRINIIAIAFSFLIFMVSSIFLLTIYTDLLEEMISKDNYFFLQKTSSELEKNMESLGNISKQFLPYGNLGLSVVRLYQLENAGDKSILLTSIKKDISLIEFSNSNISVIGFFLNDKIIKDISTQNKIEELDYLVEPILYDNGDTIYYGPHTSTSVIDDNTVISAKREINFGLEEDTYVYLEMDFDIIDKQLKERKKDGFDYIITNENNEVLYSTNDQLSNIEDISKDYIIDSYKNKYGCIIYSLINTKVMNTIKINLFFDNISYYPLLIIIGIIFGIIIVRLISKPLNTLNDGVAQIEEGDFDTLIPKTNVYEFDNIISRIHNAKLRTMVLMDEIKRKEQKIYFSELSRWRAQINPHFLLNTLNTLHWMALRDGKKEMSETVLSLNKILSYNTNKNFKSTLGDEIENINQYIELQRLKYKIDFKIYNELGDDIFLIDMPRFILQPIIENSIVHGSGLNVKITIRINIESDYIVIHIKDNGTIESGKISFINDNRETPENLGIGLAFVFSAMENYYGKDNLIEYKEKEGVEVRLLLPFGGDEND